MAHRADLLSGECIDGSLAQLADLLSGECINVSMAQRADLLSGECINADISGACERILFIVFGGSNM